MRTQATFPWLAPPVARMGRAHRNLPVPRMAPAAVRIPDPRVTQLPLTFVSFGPQIFIHEGARQALERRFTQVFNGPVQLAVTDNRHRMITHTQGDGTLRLRVHMMFLGAPDRVLDALVKYVLEGDRHASHLVGEYIDQNSYRIRAARPVTIPLTTRGRVHDLSVFLAELNDSYFGGGISDVLITWGKRTKPRGKKRTTIKLGSYSTIERLIRVHPVLDAEWVPRYFVSYIVYHELLHHVVPAIQDRGRVILHPAEFQRREQEFKHYQRAIEWERKHLDRLLRAR